MCSGHQDPGSPPCLCLNRLEEPNGGQILIDGEDITDPDADVDQLRTNIGMVFQQFNLFPHLTVLKNLTVAQTGVLGRSKAEAISIARLSGSGSPTRLTTTPPIFPVVSSSGLRSLGHSA